MTNRVVIWGLAVVAVLLVAVLVSVVVLVNTLNAQAAQRDYELCMSAQGYTRGEQPSVTTDAEADAYIDGLAEAAEFCSR